MTGSRDGWAKIDIIVKGLTPIMLFLLGTMYSYYQSKAAEAQKTADRVATLVKSLNSDKAGEKLTAIFLLKREKQRHPEAVPDELLANAVPALVNLAVNDRNAEISKHAQQLVVEVTAKTDSAFSENVNKQVENIQARVYIHIQDENQRNDAKQIENKLGEKGLIVPGIERVNKGPTTTELRYFRKSEETEVNEIVKLLHQLSITDAKSQYIAGYEDSSSIRPQHYELWFSLSSLNRSSN
jgi:hypothetical protein